MSRETGAAIVALIVKKPRTVREIAELISVRDSQNVRNHLKALEAEGLVERVSFPAMRAQKGRALASVWRWIGGGV